MKGVRPGRTTLHESDRRAQDEKTNLLELLDGTLVNTTALVDQVTGGGRL